MEFMEFYILIKRIDLQLLLSKTGLLK